MEIALPGFKISSTCQQRIDLEDGWGLPNRLRHMGDDSRPTASSALVKVYSLFSWRSSWRYAAGY